MNDTDVLCGNTAAETQPRRAALSRRNRRGVFFAPARTCTLHFLNQPERSFHGTGHSLGGALAQLLALDAHRRLGTPPAPARGSAHVPAVLHIRPARMQKEAMRR
jgi:hypothetical protein